MPRTEGPLLTAGILGRTTPTLPVLDILPVSVSASGRGCIYESMHTCSIFRQHYTLEVALYIGRGIYFY